MNCCAGSLPASLATEMGQQAETLRLEEARRATRPLPDGSLLLRLDVPDVHCATCISKIEREISKIEGVRTARVNLTLRQLSVTLASDACVLTILQSLDGMGYPNQVASDARTSDPEFKPLLRALAVAGFAATNVMLLSISIWNGAEAATRDLFHFVSAVIAIPAIAYAGQPFFRSALQALRHRRMNMDVPISLGVLLATGMSVFESVYGGGHAYFDAATSLLFFLLVGRTLDIAMRGRARQLVTRMAQMTNKGGMQILENGNVTYVPQGDITPGMLLRVAAGERLVVDAEVVKGSSTVDRSLVTGESAPVFVTSGQHVEAGVLNLSAPLDVKALRSAEKSFLGEVVQMLAAAEHGRGAYVRLADRMARIYSPVVHVLAIATFAAWMVATGGNWHQSLTVAVAVLIITCPCALGLAVPVAHVVAASNLFRRGILVKDGSALERLAEIDHVAFDKTGTLTAGAMSVASCDIPQGGAAGISKALAQASGHPAARALARYLEGVASKDAKTITEVPGFGVESVIGSETYRLGRTSWVAEIASKGVHGSGMAFGSKSSGMFTITFRESTRAGASAAIVGLKQKNIRTEIISGDREHAVAKIAASLEIAQWASAMTPAHKLARLATLAKQGHRVLMVGDGLNDAPALAAAHVSMAPSSASDIGRTAADFVFMGENIGAVTQAHDLSLRARRIVQQNFALAAIYNALAVPLAMAGYLNPLLAAIAMSTSSLLVVGNSLRLSDVQILKWKDQSAPNLKPTEALS